MERISTTWLKAKLLLMLLAAGCSGEKLEEEKDEQSAQMCEPGRTDNRLNCLTSQEDALHAQNKGDFALLIDSQFTNKKDYQVQWAELAGDYTVTYLQAAGPDCTTPADGFTPVTDIKEANTTAAFTTDGDYYLCIFADSASYETIVGKNNGIKMSLDTVIPLPPTVTGLGFTNNPALEWSWEPGDDTGNGTYRYSINNELFSENSSETESTSLTSDTLFTDGVYKLFVQASDDAGNWSESGTFESILDTTQPGVSLIELPPPAEPTHLQILVRFNEAVAGFEVSDLEVQNATVVDLTGDGIDYTLTLKPTASPVSITVREGGCTDSASNTNTASDSLVTEFALPSTP